MPKGLHASWKSAFGLSEEIPSQDTPDLLLEVRSASLQNCGHGQRRAGKACSDVRRVQPIGIEETQMSDHLAGALDRETLRRDGLQRTEQRIPPRRGTDREEDQPGLADLEHPLGRVAVLEFLPGAEQGVDALLVPQLPGSRRLALAGRGRL